MAEQGPKPGARTRERGNSDAPDPTHSQARPRRTEEGRALPPADADTKVERRASVRPSAFGAPRKSDAPTAGEADERSGRAAALSPHERVLEAARLLDALKPALREADHDADGVTPIQRPRQQRSGGAEELVVHGARVKAPDGSAPRSVPGPARRIRKPWLSLMLFAGMVALSVVPLLRYAVSNESTPSSTASAPLRRAGLAPAAVNARVKQERSTHAQAGSSTGVERERTIANALSEGNRALETGDLGAAERMFGQMLELAEDDHHAAYGLARIRLKQNNLAGAEGWIQLALRKRPRRAAYHALYAEVLTRMGRVGEARQESALAQTNEEARAAESERASDHSANTDNDPH